VRIALTRFFLQIGLFVLSAWVTLFSQQVERLSLKDAINSAHKYNPQLHSSSNQIDAERGRFWRGISPPLPSIRVSYDYIPKRSSIKQFGERTVEISQSLDFPTNIFFRGLQLSSQVSIAEAEHSLASAAITSQVKILYHNVLAKQKKIELAEENFSIAEDFAHKAEIRYNLGEATNLERLTANVQRTQAQNVLDLARNDLKISLDDFYVVLGRSKEEQNNTIILTDSLVYKPITETLEQLIEKAYAVNPQFKAASNRVSVASIGRTLAWSSFLPNLNASYYRQTVGGNSDFYGVSLGISIPIWFLFDQRGQIQEATANLNIAESNLQYLNNLIAVEIKNAFF
jgi:outer membrane protein, heavy metal efflux system